LTGLGNARSFFSLDSFQFKLIQGFASIVENTACVDLIAQGAFLGSRAAAGAALDSSGLLHRRVWCWPGLARGVVTAWLVRLRDGDSVGSFGAFWSTWNSASQGYPASKAASFFLRERACICAVGLAADLPNVSGVRFVRWGPWQPQRVEAWP
jgi:hypothetical protein